MLTILKCGLTTHLLIAGGVVLCGGAICLGKPSGDAPPPAEVVARMYQQYKHHFPNVPDIDPSEIMSATNRETVILVDVRDQKEQAVSMIPGAITQAQFEKAGDRYKGQTVVTYCTIGYRAGLYAKELRKQGWTALNLTGSILGWVHAGGHVEHEGVITNRVHVYGKKWDLLPEGYESVK